MIFLGLNLPIPEIMLVLHIGILITLYWVYNKL